MSFFHCHVLVFQCSHLRKGTCNTGSCEALSTKTLHFPDAQVRLGVDTSDQFRVTGGTTHELCVCGNQAETHTYHVTPLELGDVNITVRVRRKKFQLLAPVLSLGIIATSPLIVCCALCRLSPYPTALFVETSSWQQGHEPRRETLLPGNCSSRSVSNENECNTAVLCCEDIQQKGTGSGFLLRHA